jgi:molybdenum cofactor cytidylyltransferase
MAKIFNQLPATPFVSAVILAAGRSTRMGKAKQLLPLGASTVLETTIANVQRSAASEVILVLGAAADRIRRQTGIQTVFNSDYEKGMASSLQVGISAVSPLASSVLVVLGDQPFVQAETLDHLIHEHAQAADCVLIPTWQGRRGNPVLIPRGLFPGIALLEGDTGFRALFAAHPEQVQNVEVKDEGILLDIDSEEDYRRLSASH